MVIGADSSNTYRKLNTLKNILARMESALLACSGGTDSMFLLYAAHEALNTRLAVATVRAPYMFEEEYEGVLRATAALGLRHFTIDVAIGEGPAKLWHNPPERCYLCKKYLFTRLSQLKNEIGCAALLDGSHSDDRPEHRPGFQALGELGVVSPLRASNLTKAEIRELARKMDLAVWNKPSNSCLLTRLPYGTAVTEATLARIAAAEQLLSAHGFPEARARVHGDLLRIEADPAKTRHLLNPDAEPSLTAELKALGFRYVTVDLEGYRPQESVPGQVR